jgi:branched-chain amino acid transport system substrate-binding protein
VNRTAPLAALIPLALVALAGCLDTDLSKRPCADDTECLDEFVCAGGRCLPTTPGDSTDLLAPDFCGEIYPQAVADAFDAQEDVALIGSVLPLSGSNEAKGVARQDAVKLAVDELADINGLDGRDVGIVSCDSAGDPAQAVEVARFLTGYAGVTALVGPALSSVAVEMVDVADDANAVIMSPSATSPRLTGLSDLFWRTAASDAGQGVAIGALLLDQNVTSLAVVHSEDAYGEGLRDVIRRNYCVRPPDDTDLCLGDATLYTARGFPADGDASVAQQEAITELESFTPTAIVVAAQIGGTVDFLNLLAASNVAPDLVILPDAAKNDELLDVGDDALLDKVVGTGPATPTGAVYGTFVSKYDDAFGVNPPPTFTAHAYDALYLLAYGMGVAGPEGEGDDIALGMRKLVGTTALEVGPDNFAVALGEMSQGATYDFRGASGPLDFPAGETEAPGDIGAWHVDTGAGEITDYPDVLLSAEDGTFTSPLGP